MALEQELQAQGYSLEEVQALSCLLYTSQKGDFIIRIEFGEEADSCDREERLQT